MSSDACTTLNVLSAVEIVSSFMKEQREVTNCEHCFKKLEGNTYTTCKPNEHTTDMSHKGHTACEECVVNELYIEKNRCKACVRDMDSGRRSSIKNAGYPLFPPQLNQLATNMLKVIRSAEEKVDKAIEVEDAKRIQEGTDRRALEVERVKKKRDEEAGLAIEEADKKSKEEARLAIEEADKKSKEETRLAIEEADKKSKKEARLEMDEEFDEKAPSSSRKRKIEEETDEDRILRESKNLKAKEQRDAKKAYAMNLQTENELLKTQLKWYLNKCIKMSSDDADIAKMEEELSGI